MANITIAGLVGKTAVATDELEVQATGGGASNKVTVASIAALATGSSHVVNARLTLTSGVPVTTADVTAATSVYWTPFRGNTVTLWDGTAWTAYTLTEQTLALGTVTSGLPYDVFAFQNSGTPNVEKLAWTNGTTRATAVTLQDGRYCKSGDKTRLYVGTFYTTSTTSTEDSEGGTTTQVGGKRFLWNYYNRIERAMRVIDTADSWSYSTNTWRVANGATAPLNCCQFVVGISEDPISGQLAANTLLNSNGGATAKAGIGIDSATPSQIIGTSYNVNAGLAQGICVGQYRGLVTAGYHYAAWCEKGAAGGATSFLGDDGGAVQSGLSVTVTA